MFVFVAVIDAVAFYYVFFPLFIFDYFFFIKKEKKEKKRPRNEPFWCRQWRTVPRSFPAAQKYEGHWENKIKEVKIKKKKRRKEKEAAVNRKPLVVVFFRQNQKKTQTVDSIEPMIEKWFDRKCSRTFQVKVIFQNCIRRAKPGRDLVHQWNGNGAVGVAQKKNPVKKKTR